MLEYVFRTSLIAALVALVLTAMRIKAASARHAVWSGVVLLMLGTKSRDPDSANKGRAVPNRDASRRSTFRELNMPF